MKKRLYKSKASGQSIPLLAVMIAVLFGMAALALDVGNTYAEQREAVRATDVAAIEGINTLIDGQGDEKVASKILSSYQSHGINATYGAPSLGEMQIQANYLDSSGRPIPNCPVGSCSGIFDTIKKNITFVRVQIDGKVETYFARLAGRPDLPVHAVSHARRSICTDGVYPIAVDSKLLDLDNKRFLEPDATYKDEIFRRGDKTLKRIYLKDTNAPGNFGYLLWKGQTGQPNEPSLRASLTGAGNLGSGFEEADWPEKNKTSFTEPDGYPLVPGELNSGDWIAGATGLKNSTGDREAIDQHIQNRTILTLPIYDELLGEGANAQYHILTTGKFLLRDYGNDQGNGWYIDLVYIGDGAECASSAVAPNVSGLMSLEGQVSLYPHFAQEDTIGDLPIQYVIVLDVSGSMNWNFDGYATINGASVRCQGAGAIQCPPRSVWGDAGERRINIATETLKKFAGTVRDIDQVQIVTFHNTFGAYPMDSRPSYQEAVDALSNVYPNKLTSDKAALDAAISEAGASASGETPSAVGMARAFTIYEQAPKRDSNGKLYKRAVIFLTDGVANVTRDGQLNATCGTEDVDCQTGKFNDGTAKPINAMNIEADKLKDKITPEDAGKGGLYVIALGPTSLEALQLVSSDGKVERADDAGSLQRTLDRIRDKVRFGTCTDGVVRTSPKEQISSSALPDYSIPSIGREISAPEVGVITLTGPSAQYKGKIIYDADTQRMYYRITNIPPGQYVMTYWMAYSAPEESTPRTLIYDYAKVFGSGDGALTAKSQSISMEPSSDNFGSRIQPIVFDLDPSKDVCSTRP